MYRAAYIESEVLSASPMRLVELLYHGAIESCAKALEAFSRGDVSERNHQITRAHAIVTELGTSLDREQGGKLGKDLLELYDYMQRRLTESVTRQDPEPLKEVQLLLSTLLEAWASIDNPAAAPGLSSTANLLGNDARFYDPASQFGGVDVVTSRFDSLG